MNELIYPRPKPVQLLDPVQQRPLLVIVIGIASGTRPKRGWKDTPVQFLLQALPPLPRNAVVVPCDEDPVGDTGWYPRVDDEDVGLGPSEGGCGGGNVDGGDGPECL